MDDNVTKGKLTQLRGKAREESGKVTGDLTKEIIGQAEQAAGKIQEEFGKAERDVNKALKD